MNSLIVELERNREFLIGLVDDGGEIYLNANLDGRANIGDIFAWRSLGRIADLKINLGVEVFPNNRDKGSMGSDSIDN